MAADRSIILAWVADLATTLVASPIDLADLLDRIEAARGLGRADFAGEVLDLMRVPAEWARAPDDFARFVAPAETDAATSEACRVLLAVGLSLAAPRIDWPSRPEARTARAALADALEAALDIGSARGAAGVDLYAWLSDLGGVALRILSDLAANAVPMVRVETGVSLPASVLAWKLYGDAGRAEGLADVARSLTPMLMPVTFEALER
ncbi:hypothetical protein BJF92_12210 [Rhizobium rhizosphaerae]|uniref:Uncharacterized protein n=1 Tax=Xaviernesmea rhizosphaerae TaxID=1672749 RepID=A0A1Q9AN51_9HYPH|nr:hypothetical protein [Xaviernesmea rhizosphaerae]OLP56828.1 hypothetical protein BJF92_12210 [Xaviernesmea rhizosphaerae]